MKTEFSEVRCDYFDDFANEWCVDAWRTEDSDEQGEVVARIHPDNFLVEYTDRQYAYDELVVEVIKEKMKEIALESLNS